MGKKTVFLKNYSEHGVKVGIQSHTMQYINKYSKYKSQES